MSRFIAVLLLIVLWPVSACGGPNGAAGNLVSASVTTPSAVALPARQPPASAAASPAENTRRTAPPVAQGTTRPHGILVLMYHEVLPEPVIAHDAWLKRDPFVISTAAFEKQMAWLKRQQVETVTAQQVAQRLAAHAVGGPAVVVTFDDGYEGVYRYAYPILKRYGIKATAFVVVRWIDHASTPGQEATRGQADAVTGTPPPHPLRRRMTWAQLREMESSGWVDVESHTYDLHEGKRGLSGFAAAPPVVALADLRKADQRLAAELHVRPVAFAYPHGDAPPATWTVVREAGYAIAFTTWHFGVITERSRPLLLPRYFVGEHTDLAALWPLFAASASSPAAAAAPGH